MYRYNVRVCGRERVCACYVCVNMHACVCTCAYTCILVCGYMHVSVWVGMSAYVGGVCFVCERVYIFIYSATMHLLPIRIHCCNFHLRSRNSVTRRLF